MVWKEPGFMVRNPKRCGKSLINAESLWRWVSGGAGASGVSSSAAWCFKPTRLSRPHRASGNLHAPWASELHPSSHLPTSTSPTAPCSPPLPEWVSLPLCPAPSHPLGPCFCPLSLLSVPETRCPASPVFKNASFLSGVSLAQSQPQIPGAEASPVSLSPPHHSQS